MICRGPFGGQHLSYVYSGQVCFLHDEIAHQQLKPLLQIRRTGYMDGVSRCVISRFDHHDRDIAPLLPSLCVDLYLVAFQRLMEHRLMLYRAVFAAVSPAFILSLNDVAAKPADRILFVDTKQLDGRRIPGRDQPVRVDRKCGVGRPFDEFSYVAKLHLSV